MPKALNLDVGDECLARCARQMVVQRAGDFHRDADRLASRAAHAKDPQHFTAKELVVFRLVEFPVSERLRGHWKNGLR